MRIHELRTWPGPFAAILEGKKTFEIRKDDRGYAVGDHLLLKEFDPSPSVPGSGQARGASGRTFEVVVDYIAPGGRFGLPVELVVMSIRKAVVDIDIPHLDILPPSGVALASARETMQRELDRCQRLNELHRAELDRPHPGGMVTVSAVREVERELERCRQSRAGYVTENAEQAQRIHQAGLDLAAARIMIADARRAIEDNRGYFLQTGYHFPVAIDADIETAIRMLCMTLSEKCAEIKYGIRT